MGGTLKTHEGKHSIGIFFPTFHHLLVLIMGPIQIHREQSIGKISRLFCGCLRLSLILRHLTLLRLGLWDIWSVTGIYRGCSR